MALYTRVLKGNWVDTVMKDADLRLNKLYQEYVPVYDCIIEFLKRNKCQVSNINYLLTEKIAIDEPLYIYVINPKEVAHILLEEICKKFNDTFSLQTELTDRQYKLAYISKVYIHICKATQNDATSVFDILTPIYIRDILIVPPILELIDMYKKLYNPEYVEEWVDLIHNAAKVKKIADKNINDTAAQVKKGGKQCVDCGNKIIVEVKKLMKEFLKKYSDYVLLELPKDDDRYIIISKNSVQTDYERLNLYLSTHLGSDFVIVFNKKELFIDKDTRMGKHSFYISTSHTNKFAEKNIGFLDIYNNMEYELVPYVKKEAINIAHDWVKIRLYYIQIWTAFVKYNLKQITKDSLIDRINNLKPYINADIDWTDAPLQYMGVYVNEIQAFKLVMVKEHTNEKIYCDYTPVNGE